MSDHDRSSTTVVRETTGGGGLYFIVGASPFWSAPMS